MRDRLERVVKRKVKWVYLRADEYIVCWDIDLDTNSMHLQLILT
jgi:hypothetical protein